ncbi:MULTISPECIES: hypothetical protein [Trichocoleus]|uniref:Uncharacterized protein n=1 Tax=Trichocoleus desertorum GB2-A4 TaxID=2933944 RepID=A0ABV0JEP3_9CYAN|nr:hypothetical protein [Trichocoleus sp. FACHB-46]MBD1864178.1 hypothetical protein [Trichocoleus sp. FACHB-46]
MPGIPGQIVLKNKAFSGILKVAYSSFSGPNIQNGQAFDIEPMWRSLQPTETIVTFESLAQAADTFRLLYEVTREEQWNRAYQATLSTFQSVARLRNTVYFFRRETTGQVLSHWGTRIRTSNPNPVLALRLPNGLVRLDIPLNQGTETELKQQRIAVELAAESRIQAEIGLSTAGSVAIVLTTTDDNRWEAGFVCEGNNSVVEQSFGTPDFLQWTNETTWHAGLPFYTFRGATGLASSSVRNVAIAAGNSVVATFELAGNFDFAGAGLKGSFKEVPSPLTYALSNNPVQLRLQDQAGWYWEKLLPVTGGQFVTLVLAWSEFQLAAEQTNVGPTPGIPSIDGPIQAVEFVAGRDTSLLAIHYLGASPQRLLPPVTIKGCSIVSRESAFHSLLVGDVQLLPSEQPKYTPGVTPHAVSIQGEQVQDWRSLPIVGNQQLAIWSLVGQSEAAEQVYQFLSDAQNTYALKTGIDGPFAPAYIWPNRSNFQEEGNEFTWTDTNFDLTWGGWQAKAAVSTAYGWYLEPDASGLAQDITLRFLKFLDDSWGSGAIAWVRFSEQERPVAGGDVAIVALYAQAAVYANLAGGDRTLTYRVLSKSLNYLLENAEFPLANPPGAITGYEVAETIEALALVLKHKSQLSYPTPADLGDKDSDFAAKLVKVSQFATPLNLPQQAAYGLRFTVPVQEL